MNTLKRSLQSLLPRSAYRALTAPYHFLWAWYGALKYGFPGRELTIIGVTGTKGKSSVSEMLFAIFSEVGHKTAVAGTIRFAVGSESRPNLFKMTLPGRGFIQKFLREAVQKGATHAVLELTSEAALQYRQMFLSLNGLVFTNLQPEHLESHGSMENYFRAKYRIGKSLERSPKRPRAIIANADDPFGRRFLELRVEDRVPFAVADAQNIEQKEGGVSFTYEGVRFALRQPGVFSVMNALAAIRAAAWLGVSLETCASALAKLEKIPGRAERVDRGQPFTAVVDYAHTPDSLKALYDAFPQRKICVLGNTGGGRDTWKRPVMGKIADEECAEVILTNEDPYNEDPLAIMHEMAAGMKREPRIVFDRRTAIRTALSLAKPGDAVLITGKGTDPYIMEANGSKIPWSDSKVVGEELDALSYPHA